MIIRKDRRLAWILSIVVQMFMGVYSGIINTENMESAVFEEIFIKIKNPIDSFNDGFTISVILNLLYIVIAVIFISLFITKDYKSRCYYYATRYGSFSKFYIGIVRYCIFLSLANELSYDLGVVISILIKFNNLDFSFSKLPVTSLFNSLTIVIIFAFLSVIISLLISEKTGILIGVTLFLAFAIIMFYLPSSLIQYNIVSWYYVNEFTYNKDIFENSKIIYYLLSLIIFSAEYFISNKILKKDIL